MKRYLDFVLDKPWWIIGAIAVITAILLLGVPKLKFESSLDSIMPKEDYEYILNEQIKEIFGNNGKFIVLCASTEGDLNYRFLKDIDNLHKDIDEYKYLNSSRENGRLNKVKEFSAGDEIRFDTIIYTFNDDPVFQRYLRRKHKLLFNGRSLLSTGDIDVLVEEIESSIALKKDGLVDIIVSPMTVQDIKGEDGALLVYNIFNTDDYGNRIIPETDEDIASLRSRLINNPAFDGGIYVSDKKTGKITDFGIMIRLNDSFVYDPIVKEVREIVDGYSDLSTTIQGIPVIYREVNRYMRNDLIMFIPMVFLVVIIVFYLNFRSIRGVLLPFLTLCLADLWILGLMGHLGYSITIIGIALPPLMIAVGSSYSIHILNQYYIDLPEIVKMGKKDGLKKSMSHISITVTLAGLTTFVGFIMLISNQVSAIREWGVFSAFGVIFAVFISISLIPAVIVLLPHSKKDIRERSGDNENKGKKYIVDRVVALFINLSINHYKKVIIVTVLVLAFAIVGMSKIIVETSVHAYFKEGDPVLTSSRIIGEKFGGSYGLNIIIDSGEKNGVKDPRLLNAVEEFREWLISEENIDLNIGRTDAFGDFIKTFNLAMNDNDPDYYKIPPNKINVASYIDLFSGDDENDDGRVDAFESYVDRDYRKANVFARIWEKQGELISSAHMDHIIQRINEYLDRNLPSGYTYQTSGEPKIIVRLSRYVVNGQIMSLAFSLVVVFFIVVLLFKNWPAGFASLIPIGTAVLVNFGVMGWTGIKLDLATAIIASITIGIGIDDTIHFLNTFRYFRSKGCSVDETIEKTLSIAGKAIIYTSIALIFGFLVLIVSNFKPIILFGILVAVTMVATTMGALIVLPSAIKIMGLTLDEKEEKKGVWKYLKLGKAFEVK